MLNCGFVFQESGSGLVASATADDAAAAAAAAGDALTAAAAAGLFRLFAVDAVPSGVEESQTSDEGPGAAADGQSLFRAVRLPVRAVPGSGGGAADRRRPRRRRRCRRLDADRRTVRAAHLLRTTTAAAAAAAAVLRAADRRAAAADRPAAVRPVRYEMCLATCLLGRRRFRCRVAS